MDAYPDICRSLTINEGVDSFVMKGANVMWPGVQGIDQLPADMEADSVVCIRKSDNTVIAVGALACDVDSVQHGAKAEGVACYVLHIEGDSLWKAGGGQRVSVKWDRATQEEKEQEQLAKLQKKRDRKGDDEEEEGDLTALLATTGGGSSLPTDMTKGKVKHMPKELKMKDTPKAKPTKDTKGHKDAKDTKDSKGGKDNKDGKGGKDTKDAKGGKESKAAKKEKKEKKAGKKKRGDDESGSEGSEKEEADEQEEIEEKKPETMDDEGSEDWKNEKKGKGGKKDKKVVKAEGKEEEGPTKEQMKEMDEKIMEAFLNSVKISLQEKDLPIECGKFWTNHIIKCKTEDDDDLDLKLSSFKKIGKFFQTMQKDKILTYEEASKKNPVPKVTKIDFYCPKITAWTPTITGKVLDRRNAKDDEKGNSQKESWRTPIEIVKLYKPQDSIKCLVEG